MRWEIWRKTPSRNRPRARSNDTHERIDELSVIQRVRRPITSRPAITAGNYRRRDTDNYGQLYVYVAITACVTRTAHFSPAIIPYLYGPLSGNRRPGARLYSRGPRDWDVSFVCRLVPLELSRRRRPRPRPRSRRDCRGRRPRPRFIKKTTTT